MSCSFALGKYSNDVTILGIWSHMYFHRKRFVEVFRKIIEVDNDMFLSTGTFINYASAKNDLIGIISFLNSLTLSSAIFYFTLYLKHLTDPLLDCNLILFVSFIMSNQQYSFLFFLLKEIRRRIIKINDFLNSYPFNEKEPNFRPPYKKWKIIMKVYVELTDISKETNSIFERVVLFKITLTLVFVLTMIFFLWTQKLGDVTPAVNLCVIYWIFTSLIKVLMVPFYCSALEDEVSAKDSFLLEIIPVHLPSLYG